MQVIQSVVSRKDINAVRKVVEDADPSAFVTIEEVKSLRRGHFRH